MSQSGPENTVPNVRSMQTRLMVDKTALLARVLTNKHTTGGFTGNWEQGTEMCLIGTAPHGFGKSFVVEQLAALARWDDADEKAFAGYAVRALCHRNGYYRASCTNCQGCLCVSRSCGLHAAHAGSFAAVWCTGTGRR